MNSGEEGEDRGRRSCRTCRSNMISKFELWRCSRLYRFRCSWFLWRYRTSISDGKPWKGEIRHERGRKQGKEGEGEV